MSKRLTVLPIAVSLVGVALLTTSGALADIGDRPAQFRSWCESTGGIYSRGKSEDGQRSHICTSDKLSLTAYAVADRIVAIMTKRLDAPESFVAGFKEDDYERYGQPVEDGICKPQQAGFRCWRSRWKNRVTDGVYLDIRSVYHWKPGLESGGLYVRTVALKLDGAE